VRHLRRFSTMRRVVLALALLGLVVVVIVGLSQAGPNDKPKSQAASPREVARALRGSPAPLAALHAQANRLLVGGGEPAVRARIEALRGYPVVVNKWGSWCGPCRYEFPFLQEMALRYGRRVAFLGLNSEDNDDDARNWLRRFPVAYPNYSDPEAKIGESLGIARQATPSTLFLDRRGRMSFQHQGAYANAADFEDDIRRYALGS
jgi:cytochrome c biogenesis protein CcmG/thiol:disulfide interchange protein DsbE